MTLDFKETHSNVRELVVKGKLRRVLRKVKVSMHRLGERHLIVFHGQVVPSALKMPHLHEKPGCDRLPGRDKKDCVRSTG